MTVADLFNLHRLKEVMFKRYIKPLLEKALKRSPVVCLMELVKLVKLRLY